MAALPPSRPSARANCTARRALGPQVSNRVVDDEPPASRDIRLLGDARPYSTATLFAKVSGYLKTVTVDKGDLVQAGQVLAEIEFRRDRRQYASAALADLENKQQARRSATRDLLTRGNVSLQAAEQARDTAMRMAEEAVRNLATMRSYEIIRAPFDGTVTARFADPGALLQSATTQPVSRRCRC